MEKLLESLGLSNKEAKVYLTLLKMGQSSISEIAKNTKIDRRSCYDIINRLIGKNFVSSIEINGVNYFESIQPKILVEEFKKQVSELESALPHFSQFIAPSKNKVNLKLLKGKKGLALALQDIVETKKDYVGIGAIKFLEIIPIETAHIVKQSERFGLKERGILPMDYHKKIKGFSKEVKKIAVVPTGRYKYLEEESIFTSSFIQYGDKVALFIFEEPYYAIIIESKSISQNYYNYFEFLWKHAKK